MKSLAGTWRHRSPYFGGKSLACETVGCTRRPGELRGAVLRARRRCCSGAPTLARWRRSTMRTIRRRTLARGFASMLPGWQSTRTGRQNEADLFARHSWLVSPCGWFERPHADPEYYDAKVAGWWCWGLCNWIGSGWCSGTGPWHMTARSWWTAGNCRTWATRAGRELETAAPGQRGPGVNWKLPHLGDAGPATARTTSEYIYEWFCRVDGPHSRRARGGWRLAARVDRLRNRAAWTYWGVPRPAVYQGAMDYAAGGVGGKPADEVRAWCPKNGTNKRLRIVPVATRASTTSCWRMAQGLRTGGAQGLRLHRRGRGEQRERNPMVQPALCQSTRCRTRCLKCPNVL